MNSQALEEMIVVQEVDGEYSMCDFENRNIAVSNEDVLAARYLLFGETIFATDVTCVSETNVKFHYLDVACPMICQFERETPRKLVQA